MVTAWLVIRVPLVPIVIPFEKVTLPLAALMLIPVLLAPPVMVPVWKVIVLLVVVSMLTTRWPLVFWVIEPL